mmetsp:Transcript_18328/g.51930  ORF Transcript_18328/g.51930 Transcript_18328/m.51930 type:complete len:253 (-) Transcript_18328:948-1706(-)
MSLRNRSGPTWGGRRAEGPPPSSPSARRSCCRPSTDRAGFRWICEEDSASSSAPALSTSSTPAPVGDAGRELLTWRPCSSMSSAWYITAAREASTMSACGPGRTWTMWAIGSVGEALSSSSTSSEASLTVGGDHFTVAATTSLISQPSVPKGTKNEISSTDFIRRAKSRQSPGLLLWPRSSLARKGALVEEHGIPSVVVMCFQLKSLCVWSAFSNHRTVADVVCTASRTASARGPLATRWPRTTSPTAQSGG